MATWKSFHWMTCLLPINTNWSMRPERTRIGISKWYYTERMEQPWRITSKDHHMILSVDFSTTLWCVWSCMRWKMKSHVYFSCAQRHKASWPRYIATTGLNWCTSSPLPKTITWCRTLVGLNGGGAFEVRVTACSSLGLAQEDLHGIG